MTTKEAVQQVQYIVKGEWANPGALGLFAFGLNTLLLQVHNLGLMTGTLPLVYGWFWGGTAQVIAGIIDARRGDTFGLTAFTSYGVFWIGLGFYFLLQWMGVVKPDNAGLAWAFIFWGLFTGIMAICTLKMTIMHFTVFATLTILFFLLASVFFGVLSPVVAGAEGLICGGAAVYGASAMIINAKYGRWILPLGSLPRKSSAVKGAAVRAT